MLDKVKKKALITFLISTGVVLTVSIIYLGFNYFSTETISLRNEEAKRHLLDIESRLNKSTFLPKSRYEILNSHINRYLNILIQGNGSEAPTELSKAEQLADEIQLNGNDHWGHDLVNFYRNISSGNSFDKLTQLLAARQLCAEVESLSVGQSAEALDKLQQAKAIFTLHKAALEIEQTDVEIVHYLDKYDDIKPAQTLLEDTLQRSIKNKHPFLQAQLLLWQGELFSNVSNYNKAEQALEESIRLATPLDVPQFLAKPSMILATIYYIGNENERAFEKAFLTLKASSVANTPIPIQVLQVLGTSAFNLKYSELAEKYLDFSIQLAERQQNNPHLAFSHTLSGIIQSEQGHFKIAEDRFNKAFDTLTKISDDRVRRRMEFAVTGYYARARMLAGDTDKAITFYKRALELGKETNVQEMLSLSQLHQGLGECLAAKGDYSQAKTELTTAITFDRKARENFERNNDLLTFAVSHRTSAEQLLQLDN